MSEQERGEQIDRDITNGREIQRKKEKTGLKYVYGEIEREGGSMRICREKERVGVRIRRKY